MPLRLTTQVSDQWSSTGLRPVCSLTQNQETIRPAFTCTHLWLILGLPYSTAIFSHTPYWHVNSMLFKSFPPFWVHNAIGFRWNVGLCHTTGYRNGFLYLLPSGSEQHEVLLFGSIEEHTKILVLLGSKNKKHHKAHTHRPTFAESALESVLESIDSSSESADSLHNCWLTVGRVYDALSGYGPLEAVLRPQYSPRLSH